MRSVMESKTGRRLGAVKGFVSSAWAAAEYTRGVYPVAAPGSQPRPVDAFDQVAHGRLLLAGAHTGFAYYGSAHGALLGGGRAAAALIERLGTAGWNGRIRRDVKGPSDVR